MTCDIHIEDLTITVIGYERPESDEYYDSNWLLVEMRYERGDTKIVRRGSDIQAPELVSFLSQVEKMYEIVSGHAELSCIEPYISINLQMNKTNGHVSGLIELTPDHVKEKHIINIEIDQSYLTEIINDLRVAVNAFPVKNA
jgi:hypothetical protein